MEPCLNRKENCKGGFEGGNKLCSEGNIGALCESCDVGVEYWSESWANNEEFICGKCSSVTSNAIKVTLFNIWVLITVVLSVKETIGLIE